MAVGDPMGNCIDLLIVISPWGFFWSFPGVARGLVGRLGVTVFLCIFQFSYLQVLHACCLVLMQCIDGILSCRLSRHMMRLQPREGSRALRVPRFDADSRRGSRGGLHGGVVHSVSRSQFAFSIFLLSVSVQFSVVDCQISVSLPMFSSCQLFQFSARRDAQVLQVLHFLLLQVVHVSSCSRAVGSIFERRVEQPSCYRRPAVGWHWCGEDAVVVGGAPSFPIFELPV